MFVTNWNSTAKIQKISEITNFFRQYFLSRTEVYILVSCDCLPEEVNYSQMLKNTLSTKISTLKVFNLNLFPYLCGQYLTILKKKSQSVFHLTSGYNIGR